MNAKKILNLLGYIALSSWLLHFIVYAIIDEQPLVYETKDIVEGIVFILIVMPIYFSMVHMYFKNKKKIFYSLLTTFGVVSIVAMTFTILYSNGH